MKELSEILEGCKNENLRSQELLFNRYSRILFGVCLRYVKDFDDARDVLQESFIKIFSNIKKYRNEGSFEGWAKKITANTAIQFLKQRKKLLHVYDQIDDLVDDLAFADDEEVSMDFSPELIVECMNELPDGYRLVLNLFLMEDYTHAEIAKKLDIKEATSRSQFFKARKYLTERLNKKVQNVK